MRCKYIIEIDTDNSPVIEEQRVIDTMTKFFELVNDTYIPEDVLSITKEVLPEKTLEERMAEKRAEP
jgi:hypothetical protein